MRIAALFTTVLLSFAGASAAAEVQLTGAGATFPYPIYGKWFNEYHKMKPDVQINYQSIGSGGGIRQLTAGTVDFGASDKPMSNEEMAQLKVKPLHFPTVLGAVVPAYNLPGYSKELKLSQDALAGIFLGTIKKWNDPALVKDNPGLPDQEIVVVHRSDGSGTTFVFTDYLAKVSPEFKSKVGANNSVKFPVGLGAKGNEGVTGLIKQTPNSIGYIELVFALQNKIAYAAMKNSSGAYVKADLASVTAAAAGAAKAMPDDFRVSITDPPGKGAYPISSFTWLLVPSQIPDAAKRQVLVEFLGWMLKDGQKMATDLGFAPLPKEVLAKELKAIAMVK